MTTNELWQAVLGELELSLNKANFTTWFKNTFISAWEGDHVVVSAPNAFTKAWLEKKFNGMILKSLQAFTQNRIRAITYKVEAKPQHAGVLMQDIPVTAMPAANGGTSTQTMTKEAVATFAKKETLADSRLNPKYTFDTFIVGKQNEFAHAAAKAVAQSVGRKYNPLFIYGGVGLGKTHLLQAIGHDIIAAKETAKVLYVTSEKFMSDFIQAVKTGHGKEFKDQYRNVDLLLVDDIQLLSGRESTQEEFFHTFNALHENNKQVVLTSDRPPKLIPALEHRLISRFEWGMTVDISSPDLETRIAILKTKCEELHFALDPDIVRYIASVVQSNVRELEGALNKLIAYHQLKNTPATLENTKVLLSGMNSAPQNKSLTAKHVMATVCQYFDLSNDDMVGKCREKRLAFPRQIIMYLMRSEMSASFPSIGNEIGGRDHTTAMHAYEKISNELDNNPKLRQDIDLIKQRLYNT